MDWEYGPNTFSIPHPRVGLPWVVDMTFYGPVGPERTIECVEVRVRSKARDDLGGNDPLAGQPDASEPVAAALLRFDLATHIDAARRRIASTHWAITKHDPEWINEDSRYGELARQSKATHLEIATTLEPPERPRNGGRRGRPALTDEFLRSVLEVQAVARRNGRRDTTRAVSDHFDVELTTAKGWGNKARRRFGLNEEKKP